MPEKEPDIHFTLWNSFNNNFKGVSFRREPSGGFEDAAYCPSCRIGMAPLEPDEPLLCGKCNAFSGFNSGKLKDVMEELLLEYGES